MAERPWKVIEVKASSPYRVGIIGAGRIASGFDAPGAPHVLTHAHAVVQERRMKLVGFWDTDPAAASAASRKWGVEIAGSLDELFSRSPDILIVAVPDTAHVEYLNLVAAVSPSLVVCEKPLTETAAMSERIAAKYAAMNIPLLVNYQRRFDPEVIELRRRFRAGRLGRALGGVVWYSKGIMHNGSHAVDLLRFLFGEPRAVSARQYVEDFSPADPTVSGTLDFGEVAIELVAGDERKFSLFEIDLLFEKCRYRFTHSGLMLEIFEPREDPVFAGYVELFPVRNGPTGLPYALKKLMNAVADHLDGGATPAGDAADAVQTQQVCEKLAHDQGGIAGIAFSEAERA